LIKDINELLEKIPIWKKLIHLPDKFDDLEKRIKSIENRMSGSGELCPYCKEPALQLLEIKPDKTLGALGIRRAYYKCNNCQKPYDKELTPGT
jgi:uncharacterized protein with PIN domain